MTTTIAPPSDPRLRARPPAVRPATRRRSRLAFRCLAALAMVATLAVTREPLFIVGVLFVIVVPLERLFPRHRGQRLRRPQLSGDIAHALTAPLAQLLTLVVAVPLAIASFAWLPGLALRPVVAMIPPFALPFVGIALFDLTIYWTHRLGHEVPFLWRFHSIHHSTEHLDWISGFRNHPFDGAFIAPAFVFLLSAGFSAEFSGALAIVQLVTGLFLHANVKWRLRWLHPIVITPEFHHWHHANERDAHNANYSVFLPIWDIVFGTYFMPKDRRPTVYGVDEYVPEGLVPQLAHPLRGMGNPMRVLRHPIRSTRGGIRFARALARDMWRSFRRPTRRSARVVAPGTAA